MRAPNPSKWSDASRNPSRAHARFGKADQGIEAQQRWRAMTREYSLESGRHGRLLLMHSCCGWRDRGPFMPNRIGGSNEGRPQTGRLVRSSTEELKGRLTTHPCHATRRERRWRIEQGTKREYHSNNQWRMTVHHYHHHHHHVVLTPGLCRSILCAFVLQLSMRLLGASSVSMFCGLCERFGWHRDDSSTQSCVAPKTQEKATD